MTSQLSANKKRVSGNLDLRHTNNKQIVHLENLSEITGNIIFEDGNGEVVVRGKSKIGGKVIGGHTSFN